MAQDFRQIKGIPALHDNLTKWIVHSVAVVPIKTIHAYRANTFRLLPGKQLKSLEEAVEFVNERGFIFFWPIKDILMPSLWTAVAGDRPVADEHDDPGHVTWGWKDAQLGKDLWYYAKILRKRATMIAMDIAPYFYALTENYGSPEEDYLTTYEQGRMTQEAKTVYEVLLDEGPLDTISLRRKSHLTSRESDSRFNKALTDLQTDFKVVPVGVTDAGAWHYAFAYDITARHYPEISERARFIGEKEARRKLVELYFRSVGIAKVNDVTKLFRWRPKNTEEALESLVQAGSLKAGLKIEKRKGDWYGISDIIKS